MNFYCLIIYSNKKNETIFRLNKISSRKIGENTSMGWLVLDKQYYIEKNKMFVGEETMRKIMNERHEEFVRKEEKKERIKKITKIMYDIFR